LSFQAKLFGHRTTRQAQHDRSLGRWVAVKHRERSEATRADFHTSNVVIIAEGVFPSMKHGLFALLMLGLISVGCTSTNKAATPDTAAQPNSGAAASSPSNKSDQEFVTKAAQGNSAEVELGKIVAAKSKTPSVKQFAQMMVKDHTTALNELQELAQSKNLNFNDDLPDDAKALQAKLSSDTGKQLDKDYMDGMVEDHQKDIQEFTGQLQNAKDPDVKQWASKTLPTLQKHLEKAQQIDSKLSKRSRLASKQ
jgi:putative membrane protein